MKKLLKITLSLLLILSTAACGKTEQKTEVQEDVSDKVEVAVKNVEARTAIIFSLSDKGTATITRDNEDDQLYVGLRLLAGDIVTTDEQATAYIRIDDDKNVLLECESKIAINELSDNSISINLLSGGLFFDIENKISSDETISFSTGGTTMSIRGTSGGLSAKNNQFKIFEGKADIKTEQNINFTLNAGNKVETGSGEIKVENITKEDLSNTFVDYLKSNEDYKNKLENAGWEIGENNEIEKIQTTSISPSEFGFTQNKDGSWTYNKQDYENKVDSKEYEEPKKETKTEEKPTLVIQEETKQESSKQEDPAPKQKTVCSHCGNEIEDGDTTHTTLLNTDAAITAIKAKNTTTTVTKQDLSGDYYLCQLDDYTDRTIAKYCYVNSNYILAKLNEYPNTKVFVKEEAGNTYSTILKVDGKLFKDFNQIFGSEDLANQLLDYCPINAAPVSAKLTGKTSFVTGTSGSYTNLLSDTTFGTVKGILTLTGTVNVANNDKALLPYITTTTGAFDSYKLNTDVVSALLVGKTKYVTSTATGGYDSKLDGNNNKTYADIRTSEINDKNLLPYILLDYCPLNNDRVSELLVGKTSFVTGTSGSYANLLSSEYTYNKLSEDSVVLTANTIENDAALLPYITTTDGAFDSYALNSNVVSALLINKTTLITASSNAYNNPLSGNHTYGTFVTALDEAAITDKFVFSYIPLGSQTFKNLFTSYYSDKGGGNTTVTAIAGFDMCGVHCVADLTKDNDGYITKAAFEAHCKCSRCGHYLCDGNEHGVDKCNPSN